jgi:hypothetical protein
MKLKFELDKIEDAPEQHRELYEPTDDGRFRLSVEGAASNKKVDEFRTNNIQLHQDRDRLVQELSKHVPQEKVNEIAERLAQEKTRDLNEKLTKTLVEKHIMALAGTAGVRPEATEDVMRRAHDLFKVGGDGTLVPRSATGDELNAADLLKPEEWLTSLKSTHPHYWHSSNGGGAPGNDRGSDGRFKRESKVKFKEDLKSPMEKSDFIREHGLKAFEELPMKQRNNSYQRWQKSQKQEN